MTFDEILFLFLMPIILFYVIQAVLLAEFWQLAVEMLRGRKIVSLLCEYDSCVKENRFSCLSDLGKREMTMNKPICFEIPIDCHEDIDNLKNYPSLNPFRRIREDFLVLVFTIFLSVLFFDLYGIITIPDNLKNDFFGLYITSIATLIALGFIYKPDRDDIVVLVAGVHACIGAVLFWYLRAFEVKWEKLPFLINNKVLASITNNFTIEMPLFIMYSIFLITLFTTIPWRILVPNEGY